MRVPLYGSCIWLGTGKDAGACLRSLPTCVRKRAIAPQDDWSGCFVDLEDGDFIVMLKTDGGHVDCTDIFHEIEHATMAICKRHGIVCDPDNDEAAAYLQGWLGEWLMRELKRRGLRPK